MKAFNLTRLMDSCCVDIDSDVYDALHDYLMEIDVDLNNLNIDDLVVNSLSSMDVTEYEEFYKDDFCALTTVNDTVWFLQWKLDTYKIITWEQFM